MFNKKHEITSKKLIPCNLQIEIILVPDSRPNNQWLLTGLNLLSFITLFILYLYIYYIILQNCQVYSYNPGFLSGHKDPSRGPRCGYLGGHSIVWRLPIDLFGKTSWKYLGTANSWCGGAPSYSYDNFV